MNNFKKYRNPISELVDLINDNTPYDVFMYSSKDNIGFCIYTEEYQEGEPYEPAFRSGALSYRHSSEAEFEAAMSELNAFYKFGSEMAVTA